MGLTKTDGAKPDGTLHLKGSNEHITSLKFNRETSCGRQTLVVPRIPISWDSGLVYFCPVECVPELGPT